MDAAGKAYYDHHPFLSSIPKDLFKLVLLGTVGLLFLDEWRSQVQNWPSLREHFIGTEHAVAVAIHSIAKHLGRNDILLAPGGTSYAEKAEDFSNQLRESGALFAKAILWHSGTMDLDQAWRQVLLSDGIPSMAQSDDDPLQLTQLRSALGETAQFASPGTRVTIAEAIVHIRDVEGNLGILVESLRRLHDLDSSQEFLDIQFQFTRLANVVYFLAASLRALGYEVRYASAFPYRRYQD